MKAPRMLSILGALVVVFFSAGNGECQKVTQTSVPLGDALNRALERSLLTGADASPFHIKVHLVETTNPSSSYRGEIEEYWVSDRQWKRTIDTPDFKQTLIVNGEKTSEQDTGDYYPLWLRRFVVGVFDMVSNPEQWGKMNATVTQSSVNGNKSLACVHLKSKLGTETVNNDAFSVICFDATGELEDVVWPGYDMGFGDYQPFGKKMVARRYSDSPEPGTTIVAHVELLDELKNPDASMFAIANSTPAAERIVSLPVTQSTIERAEQGQTITWPPVQSGKTTGVLTMYISVDRQGHVREAYPLNADNAGLQDAARDQLLKWQLKPMTSGGVRVQAEAGLTFKFETTLADGVQPEATSDASPANSEPAKDPLQIDSSIASGLLIKRVQPIYPAEARRNRIQGTVVMQAEINKNGEIVNLRVTSSPSSILTDAAASAVQQWRYRPYMVNGQPVDVQTLVRVNFSLSVR